MVVNAPKTRKKLAERFEAWRAARAKRVEPAAPAATTTPAPAAPAAPVKPRVPADKDIKSAPVFDEIRPPVIGAKLSIFDLNP
jgi:hypothetical protein